MLEALRWNLHPHGEGCLPSSCSLHHADIWWGSQAHPRTPSEWSVEGQWERSGPCSPTDPGSCHSGLWPWASHSTSQSLSFLLCKMGQRQLVGRLGAEAGTGV